MIIVDIRENHPHIKSWRESWFHAEAKHRSGLNYDLVVIADYGFARTTITSVPLEIITQMRREWHDLRLQPPREEAVSPPGR